MPRDADILAGMSDEQILAEMRAGNRAVIDAWNIRHAQRMEAWRMAEHKKRWDAIWAMTGGRPD